jgi:hypothetical protein
MKAGTQAGRQGRRQAGRQAHSVFIVRILYIQYIYTFSKCVGKCRAIASVHRHHSIAPNHASTAFVARLWISTSSQNTKRKAFYLSGIVSLLTIHKLRSIHPASMSPLKVCSCTCKARRCAGAHCCCFWPPCCHISLFIFEFSSRTIRRLVRSTEQHHSLTLRSLAHYC